MNLTNSHLCMPTLMSALKLPRAFVTPLLSISIVTEKRLMRCLVQEKRGSMIGCGCIPKCRMNCFSKSVASLIAILCLSVILKALYHPQRRIDSERCVKCYQFLGTCIACAQSKKTGLYVFLFFFSRVYLKESYMSPLGKLSNVVLMLIKLHDMIILCEE